MFIQTESCQDTISKFQTRHKFTILNTQNMFHTKFVRMFVNSTKFYILPTTVHQSELSSRTNSKHKFHGVTMLSFYILQRNCLIKSYEYFTSTYHQKNFM